MHRFIPALIVGLFAGRVLSEGWALATGRTAGVVGALVMTAVTTAISVWLLRRAPWRTAWPLMLLGGYVLYPQPQLTVALLVTAVTVTTFAQQATLQKAWSRFSPRQSTALLGGGMALLALFAYAATRAPGILPADNGEFQLIAATLGVAHPPGYPLYTLLAFPFTRLPLLASPAVGVTLFAALCSAVTLWLTYRAVLLLTQRHWAAGTAVLALGTSTTFWAQATTANIRSLTALFAALLLLALLKFAQAPANRKDAWLSVAAAAVGFGVTHHPSLIFMAAVGGVFVPLTDRRLLRNPRRWGRPFLFALLGLLPLLSRPRRAGSGAPGAAASLATWRGFWDHVLARGFQGDYFYYIEPGVLWERLRIMGSVLTFQFNGWLLAGMALGGLVLLLRDRRAAWLLLGSFGLHTFITATYRAPQTVEYMLPAYVPLAICLGVGVGLLLDLAQAALYTGERRAWLGGLAGTAVLFTAAVAQGAAHYPSFAALHRSQDAFDYTQVILDAAPDGALVLADWHWFSPLRYRQQVDGQRPDLTIKFVPPGVGPYAATWAQAIADGLAAGEDVIATHFEAGAYAALPPAEPLGEAFWFRQAPRTALPPGMQPLETTLGSGLTLRGYGLDGAAVPVGETAVLTLAWESIDAETVPLYAHLIGIDGRLTAQADVQVRPQPEGVTLTRFTLTPRPGALPGDYVVRIGSGAAALDLTTLTVQAAPMPPVTQQPAQIPILGETTRRQLVGYDWDHTLLTQPRLYLHWRTPDGYITETSDDPAAWLAASPPAAGVWGVPRPLAQLMATQPNQQYAPLAQGIVLLGNRADFRAAPGETVIARPRFGSRQPVLRDVTISVRLVGYEADSALWAWSDLNDAIPAMGAMPTLKWIGGTAVTSPHALGVGETAVPGQRMGQLLRLYDAFTNQPLAILDERIVAQYPWIPLADGVVAED